MAEKLVCAVTVKLAESAMVRASAVAQMQGLCVPEYMRALLDIALTAKEAEYRALAGIFGAPRASGQENLVAPELPLESIHD